MWGLKFGLYLLWGVNGVESIGVGMGVGVRVVCCGKELRKNSGSDVI